VSGSCEKIVAAGLSRHRGSENAGDMAGQTRRYLSAGDFFTASRYPFPPEIHPAIASPDGATHPSSRQRTVTVTNTVAVSTHD
jgi:hypothetical protein